MPSTGPRVAASVARLRGPPHASPSLLWSKGERKTANWFLGLSALLVATAFYLTYRRGLPRRVIEEVLLWISAAVTVGVLFYTIRADGL